VLKLLGAAVKSGDRVEIGAKLRGIEAAWREPARPVDPVLRKHRVKLAAR
jgi:hypothetical protein